MPRAASARRSSKPRVRSLQRDRFATAGTWLDNAALDLALAGDIAQRYPSRACFRSQQAAELALKGALMALSDDHPRSQVGEHLTRELEQLGEGVPPNVVAASNRLDLSYIGSRYHGLGGADPVEVLQHDDAARAIELANVVLAFAGGVVRRAALEAEPGN